MNCKEFERLIPEFMNKNLEYARLKEFSAHMQECPQCKEELVIQFLVVEGIHRLEDGTAFDLQGELNNRLDEASKVLKKDEKMIRVGVVLQIIAICIIIGVGISLFL